MNNKLISFFLLTIVLTACSFSPSESDIQTAINETAAAEPSETPLPIQPSTKTLPPTVLPSSTPTLSAVDWFINQVEIDEFRLFNAGVDFASAQREYSHNFGQANARFIYCELDLTHTEPKENKTFVMRAVFHDPDGAVYGEAKFVPLVKEGWTNSNWVLGYGWDEPGNWDVGSYRVDVYVGDEKITSNSFDILPEPLATPTSTPRPGAVVDTASLNVRKGPGTEYAQQTSVTEGEQLEIIGQAHNCAWLKIKTTKGIEGWVSSELVMYETSCNGISSAPIPPTPKSVVATPTPAPASKPTEKPTGKTIKVKIINDTGGTITLDLNGPASYSFTLGSGTHTIKVIKGTYNYAAWGCGSSNYGSKKLNDGDEWRWYCD
jgi:hypothetical protein